MSTKHLIAIIATAISLSVSAAPAFAEGSIGAGVYTSGGNGSSATGGGVLLGTGASIPVLPVSVGLTGFVPIATGGGYAVTLDGTFAAGGGNALGVGYGFGQFGGAHSGGTLTAFLDHRVAPLTTIELRGYHTTAAGGGTAGVLALKFSL
jgi:hypothetical protein